MIEKLKNKWGIFKIILIFKRQVRRFYGNSDINERFVSQLKTAISWKGFTVIRKNEKKAADKLLDFMRETAWRHEIYTYIIEFSEGIRYI